MDPTKYGTEHERFLGSGIVDLSQIDQYPHPDPFHHFTSEFRKERKRLEQQFRHEVSKPWLPEHHLKAQVSPLHWENKTITGWKVLEGYRYPCLMFNHGTKIHIIERLALLEIARASSVWGLAQVFDPLEPQQRWWVFDFFRDDGSNSSNAASQSQYRAVMNGLGSAKQGRGDRQLLYNPSLLQDLNKDMSLVSGTAGVCEALDPLCQIPAMWLTKSFQWLNDIRASWCIEEVINYIKHIVSQWTKITLQWDPIVVRSFDPESISMLQSRAPFLSTQDQDYIVHVFKHGKILTHLTDKRLREAVETEVCRQGPILTLATFAKDLREVKTRVHGPLIVVLGTMRRESPRNDTLRKKVSEIFEEEFEVLTHSRDRNVCSTIHKTAFVQGCYQRLFLDALRTRGTKGSVTRGQLSKLAESEFNRLQCDGIGSVPGYVNGNGGSSVIVASDGTLLSDSGWQDVDVERRHGNLLFKDAAATTLLYSERMHEKHPRRCPISKAFMANYIARIFLFGGTRSPEACPVPSRSPQLSLNTIDGFLSRLPFGSRDSASVYTFDDCDSASSYVSEIGDTASVRWRRPNVQMATASSKAASMIGSETSCVELEKTLNETKKRSRAVPRGGTPADREPGHLSTPKKHRHSLSSPLGSSPNIHQSVENWVRYPTRLVIQQGYQVPSLAPSIIEETYRDEVERYETPKTEPCAVVRISPNTRSMYSPSIYSLDGCSLVSRVRSPEYRRSSDPAETYESLLWNQNPFSSDRTGVPQVEAKRMVNSKSNGISTEYNRVDIHDQSPTVSLNQTRKSVAGTYPKIHVGPQAARHSTASAQLHVNKSVKTGSQYISYRSILKPNISYRAPSDPHSIKLFVQSQRSVDPMSSFWYTLNGNDKICALSNEQNHEQLQTVIEKYRLDTIYVNSVELGSTDLIGAGATTASSTHLR